MDWTSVVGILIAIVGIVLGQSLDGGKLASLVQPSAFIIVVFGTLGAVLLQSKQESFFNAMRKLGEIFVIPRDDRSNLAERIGSWSLVARREGTLQLQRFAAEETDPFIHRCLYLVIDGVSAQAIKEIGSNEIYQYETAQRNAIKVWDSAGGYAPTVGIMAAVMGLIHVMENLASPSSLGPGIAIAFVSTIYGVGLANLFFIPIANKLKANLHVEITEAEMVVDALSSIAGGESSIIVNERLSGYQN